MTCKHSLIEYRYNIPVYSKIAIDGTFKKFMVYNQATTMPNDYSQKQGYQVSFNLDKISKHIKSIRYTILYLINRVKGKCMSIVLQNDANVLQKEYNRMQIEYIRNRVQKVNISGSL